VTEAIRTADLTKRYGETVALDGLGLSIEAGEVHGYPGPNGAGKTTTIRLLLGIHRPSRSRAATGGGPPLQVPRRPGHPRRGREEAEYAAEHVARLRLLPGRIVLRLHASAARRARASASAFTGRNCSRSILLRT
jgi:ABC-type branched-subunit amino acid transport system ATPase component